jgi:hypothetical protein
MLNSSKFYQCKRVECYYGKFDFWTSPYIWTNHYRGIYLDRPLQCSSNQGYYVAGLGCIFHLFHLDNLICLKFASDLAQISEGEWIYITDNEQDFTNKELWWKYLAEEDIKDITKINLITQWL